MTAPGRVERPEPGLRRVLAPNPSPLTGAGTNSYILGQERVAVIDPGPDDPAHLAALLAALAPGERVGWIVLTHSHRDHAGLARALADATGAPMLGFGPVEAGRSAVMAALAGTGLQGSEGVVGGFTPDETLGHGATLDGDGWRLQALHTPGHMANHLCLRWGAAVFSGDHVMGWASTLVSPPEGDMGQYMASLDALEGVGAARLYPGHGAPVADPAARIAELRAHRRMREGQIITALADGPADCTTLAARLYTDTPPALLGAAARNVLAHLIDLHSRGMVTTDGPPAPDRHFALTR